MKNLFEEFFPKDESFFKQLWKNAIIAFDANVLLDFYRYSEDTQNDLFSTIEKLSDKIWLPHQAALEFSRNRPSVIISQKNFYLKAYQVIENLKENAADEIKKQLNFRVHPSINKREFLEDIEQKLDVIKKDIEVKQKEHPNLLNNDSILERILNHFDQKVGPEFSDDKLTEIFKEGESRYKDEIPPGYKDYKKGDDNQFGDLVLWKQLIQKAKKEKKPIILVGNDVKEDWYWKVSGQTIGCRPELQAEMKKEADVSFHSYTTENFLKYAQEHLAAPVHDSSISEIKEVREKTSYDSFLKHYSKSILPNNIVDTSFINQVLKNNAALTEATNITTNKYLENFIKQRKDIERIANINLINPTNILGSKYLEKLLKQQEDLKKMANLNFTTSFLDKYSNNKDYDVDDENSDVDCEDEDSGKILPDRIKIELGLRSKVQKGK